LGPAGGWHYLSGTLPSVVRPAILIWIIACVGGAAILWDRDLRAHAIFLYGFVVFSCLAVCPGLYFRRHYFILVLPAVALLTGVAVSSATRLLRRKRSAAVLAVIPVFMFLGASIASVAGQRAIFFKMDPTEASLATYGDNPFPEALPISNYLASHMSTNQRVAILGSEPEIYFYTRRHSASGYIYVYPLMEEQKYAAVMQKQMISDIESAAPEFLVFVQVPTSWAAGKETPETDAFLSWTDNYIESHYELVGIADMLGAGHTEYRWDDQARTYEPRSRDVVQVFRRAR
jgi:hypothetical protein